LNIALEHIFDNIFLKKKEKAKKWKERRSPIDKEKRKRFDEDDQEEGARDEEVYRW